MTELYAVSHFAQLILKHTYYIPKYHDINLVLTIQFVKFGNEISNAEIFGALLFQNRNSLIPNWFNAELVWYQSNSAKIFWYQHSIMTKFVAKLSLRI